MNNNQKNTFTTQNDFIEKQIESRDKKKTKTKKEKEKEKRRKILETRQQLNE